MKLQTLFLGEFCKTTNLQIHPWESKDDIFFPSGNTMESCKIVTWCWCLYSDFLSQTLQKTLHNDGLFQLVQTKIQNMTARSYYQLYGLEFCEFQELLPAKSAAWDWEYLPDRRQLAKFCHISSSQSAFILSVYWRLDIQVCTDLPITILSRDQLEIMNLTVLYFYLFN